MAGLAQYRQDFALGLFGGKGDIAPKRGPSFSITIVQENRSKARQLLNVLSTFMRQQSTIPGKDSPRCRWL